MEVSHKYRSMLVSDFQHYMFITTRFNWYFYLYFVLSLFYCGALFFSKNYSVMKLNMQISCTCTYFNISHSHLHSWCSRDLFSHPFSNHSQSLNPSHEERFIPPSVYLFHISHLLHLFIYFTFLISSTRSSISHFFSPPSLNLFHMSSLLRPFIYLTFIFSSIHSSISHFSSPPSVHLFHISPLLHISSLTFSLL